MFQDADIDALLSLGLTLNQARIYLAFPRASSVSIKDLSQASGIARQDIYRLVEELLDLGLILRVLGQPVRFKALSLEDGVSILLERVRENSRESERKALGLIGRAQRESYEIDKRKQKLSEFCFLPKYEAIACLARKKIQETKKTIDYATSRRKLFSWVLGNFDVFQDALDRGVRIRCIINFSKQEEIPEKIRLLELKTNFTVRHTPAFPSIHMGIYDNIEAIVATTPFNTAEMASALWTSNSCFLELAQEHFNSLWASDMLTATISAETLGTHPLAAKKGY